MDKIIFAKFSRERREKFQISTIIGQKEDGTALNGTGKYVRKTALSPKSVPHIQSLIRKSALLQEVYKSGKLAICPCCLRGNDSVEFAFLQGKNMERSLIEAIQTDDFQTLYDLVSAFWDILNSAEGLTDFRETEEFISIFGQLPLPEGMKASPVCNLDMMFGNMIQQEQIWLIDYEWVFEFPIPVTYLFARSLMLSAPLQRLSAEQMDRLYQIGHVSQSDLPLYYEMEVRFQQYVSGENERTVLSHLYPRMKTRTFRLVDWDVNQTYYPLIVSGLDAEGGETEIFYKICNREQVKERILLPCDPKFQTIHLKLSDTNGLLNYLKVCDQDGKEIPFSSNVTLLENENYYFVQGPELVLDAADYREIQIEYRFLYRNNGMIGPMAEVKNVYNQRFQELMQELEDKQAVLMQHVGMVNDLTAQIRASGDLQFSQATEIARLRDALEAEQQEKAALQAELDRRKEEEAILRQELAGLREFHDSRLEVRMKNQVKNVLNRKKA